MISFSLASRMACFVTERIASWGGNRRSQWQGCLNPCFWASGPPACPLLGPSPCSDSGSPRSPPCRTGREAARGSHPLHRRLQLRLRDGLLGASAHSLGHPPGMRHLGAQHMPSPHYAHVRPEISQICTTAALGCRGHRLGACHVPQPQNQPHGHDSPLPWSLWPQGQCDIGAGSRTTRS